MINEATLRARVRSVSDLLRRELPQVSCVVGTLFSTGGDWDYTLTHERNKKVAHMTFRPFSLTCIVSSSSTKRKEFEKPTEAVKYLKEELFNETERTTSPGSLG